LFPAVARRSPRGGRDARRCRRHGLGADGGDSPGAAQAAPPTPEAPPAAQSRTSAPEMIPAAWLGWANDPPRSPTSGRRLTFLLPVDHPASLARILSISPESKARTVVVCTFPRGPRCSSSAVAAS